MTFFCLSPVSAFANPLHEAIKNSNPAAIEQIILEIKRSGSEIDTLDEQGYTPLHWAVNCPVTTAKLLEAGANPNFKGPNDQTPLHLATIRYSYDDPWVRGQVINLLLAHGGDSEINDQVGHSPKDYASKHFWPKDNPFLNPLGQKQ